MPKKFIKRYLPDPKLIKDSKALKIFGALLHSNNLWHLNRRSVSRAFAVGLFCAFVPLPFQMVLAAALAILFRANILISVALVWITNPITMPPMFYFAYKVGTWILGIPARSNALDFSFSTIAETLKTLWQPLFLGSLICGIVSAILGYVIIRLLWRLMLVQHLAKRKRR